MKRGEKDFQPEGTNIQSEILHESRQAMYLALQSSRGHSGKQHLTARWYPDHNQARVDPPAKGIHFQTMGTSDSSGNIWLNFEEVLYLVERGSLECHWLGEDQHPMTLQTLYSLIFGPNNDTIGHKSLRTNDIEIYQVYSYLKRAGFIVRRAFSEDGSEVIKNSHNSTHLSRNLDSNSDFIRPILRSSFKFLKSVYLFMIGYIDQTPILSFLLQHAFHGLSFQGNTNITRSYKKVYQSLNFIPQNPITRKVGDSELSRGSALSEDNKASVFKPVFSVWKPRENFRKSNPGRPDWYFSVVSTLDSKAPTLSQTIALVHSVPVSSYSCIPSCVRRNKELVGRKDFLKDFFTERKIVHDIRCQTNLLRIGCSNVIVATVDAGIINMSSISKVPFGDELVCQD